MVDTPFTDIYIETDAELEALIGADPRAAAVALKALAAAAQEWYCQEEREVRRLEELCHDIGLECLTCDDLTGSGSGGRSGDGGSTNGDAGQPGEVARAAKVALTKDQAYAQFDAARLRHGELINAKAPEAQIKAALAEKRRLRNIYQSM